MSPASMFRAAPLLAAALASQALAAEPPPAAGGLEKAGWTFIALSEETAVYMKDAQPNAASPHRQVLTAYEALKPMDRQGFAFRSVESLGEYDCSAGRTRVVRETFYAEASLSGETWRPPNFQATDWVEPSEGSIGELRIGFACRVRPSA